MKFFSLFKNTKILIGTTLSTTAVLLAIIIAPSITNMIAVNNAQVIAASALKQKGLVPDKIYHFYQFTAVLCHYYEYSYPFIAHDSQNVEHRGLMCVGIESHKPRMASNVIGFGPNNP